LPEQFARRSRARFFAQRQFQVAFHEASFGSVNRRAANRDTARDRLIAHASVGGQQYLGAFQFAGRMSASAQQLNSALNQPVKINVQGY
jgi:hypothetical protein